MIKNLGVGQGYKKCKIKVGPPYKYLFFNFRCSHLLARAKMGFGFGPNHGPNRSEKCSEKRKTFKKKNDIKAKG